MNFCFVARGSQESGFTRPGTHLTTHLCSVVKDLKYHAENVNQKSSFSGVKSCFVYLAGCRGGHRGPDGAFPGGHRVCPLVPGLGVDLGGRRPPHPQAVPRRVLGQGRARMLRRRPLQDNQVDIQLSISTSSKLSF